MLNGNMEPLPQPQPNVPLLEGVLQGGQVVVVVEEPFESVAMDDATFEGPGTFVHAPRYEWHLECVSRSKMKNPTEESLH